MSRETSDQTRSKGSTYLLHLMLHAIGFLSLVITRAALQHPGILHNPLSLFVSLLSFFYISTLATHQMNTAYHSLVMNYKFYLESEATEPTRDLTAGHYGMFILKSSATILSNTVLLLYTAVVLSYPMINVSVASIGFLSYHVVTMLRDYCSSCYAFEFVDQYFGVTMLNNANILRAVSTYTDPPVYFDLMRSSNADLANQPHLCCMLHEVIPKQVPNTGYVVMEHPMKLKHKTTGATYWVESDAAFNWSNDLKDYSVTPYHHKECQDKIREIRAYLASMTDRVKAMKGYREQLRTVISDPDFRNYMQAIQSTENVSLDTNIPAGKSATLNHEISSTLNRQKIALLKHFEHGPIRTLTDQPPLSKGRSKDICGVTGDPINVPIAVQLTLTASASDSSQQQFFYCDLYSLAYWLDSDPNEKSDDRRNQDLLAINEILNDRAIILSELARQQLLALASELKKPEITSCNPLGYLIMANADTCYAAISALLDSSHMRSRVHDQDMMKTINTTEKGYLCLSDYLTGENLNDLHALITDRCYEPIAASYQSTDGFTTYCTDDLDYVLLGKCWPFDRATLLSPDVEVSFSLATSLLDEKHQFTMRVAQEVLAPKAQAIKAALSNDTVYYIQSGESPCKGFKGTASEISNLQLIEMSMYSDKINILPSPLQAYSMHSGVRYTVSRSSEQSQMAPSPRQLFPGSPE